MRTENDFVIFEYPGGQISFHKDLKKYFEIRQRILAFEADSVGDIEKINTADDAKKTTNSIGLKLIHVVSQEILPTLAGYGIYDLTIDDFLEKNPGFTQLVDATGELLGYSSSLNNEFQAWARNEKEKAEIQAKQSITGPEYGIISSDWVAHAIYAAKSASVVKKQAAAAQAQYNQNAWAIDNATSQVTYSEVKKLIQSTFKPIALNYLSMAFEFVLSKYVEYLEQAGAFASNCLDGIDEARSTTILDNLDYIAQKDPVIYQAIQLCPYNLKIYSVMCDEQIPFLQVHKDILSYFRLLDGFCEYIREGCVYTGGTMSEIYRLNQYRFLQLSFLEGITFESAAHSCLLPALNKSLEIYERIARALQHKVSLIELSKEYDRNDDGSKFIQFIRDEMEIEYRKFTQEEIEFCRDKCEIDVFSVLSSWFNFEIHSFRELIAFILQKWDDEVRAAAEKKKIEKKREEINTQKAKIQELTKQLNTPTTADERNGIGFAAIFGLFCVFGPILFFVYNGNTLDDFFFIMMDGFMGFCYTILILLIMGFGAVILFLIIANLLFGKKRLQQKLEEETQKLLAMEKMGQDISSPEKK